MYKKLIFKIVVLLIGFSLITMPGRWPGWRAEGPDIETNLLAPKIDLEHLLFRQSFFEKAIFCAAERLDRIPGNPKKNQLRAHEFVQACLHQTIGPDYTPYDYLRAFELLENAGQLKGVRFWNAERLRVAYDNLLQLKNHELAAALGTSERAVSTQLSKLGWSRTRIVDSEKSFALIKVMKEQGRQNQEIAEELNAQKIPNRWGRTGQWTQGSIDGLVTRGVIDYVRGPYRNLSQDLKRVADPWIWEIPGFQYIPMDRSLPLSELDQLSEDHYQKLFDLTRRNIPGPEFWQGGRILEIGAGVSLPEAQRVKAFSASLDQSVKPWLIDLIADYERSPVYALIGDGKEIISHLKPESFRMVMTANFLGPLIDQKKRMSPELMEILEKFIGGRSEMFLVSVSGAGGQTGFYARNRGILKNFLDKVFFILEENGFLVIGDLPRDIQNCYGGIEFVEEVIRNAGFVIEAEESYPVLYANYAKGCGLICRKPSNLIAGQDNYKRLSSIQEEVGELMKERLGESFQADAHHGLRHVLDVMEKARTLAEKSGNERAVDWKVLVSAAFTHDIFAAKGELHGEEAARFVENNFRGHAYFNDRQVDMIKEAVEFHDKKVAPEKHRDKELCLETKLLYDADNLDAFGIKGIYRYFCAHISRGKVKGESAREVLARIKERVFWNVEQRYQNLYFDLSREIAAQEYPLTRDFFDKLVRENYPAGSRQGATGVFSLIWDNFQDAPQEIARKALSEDLKARSEISREILFYQNYFKNLAQAYSGPEYSPEKPLAPVISSPDLQALFGLIDKSV